MGPAEHWKREKGGRWNDGYSRTAYFFDWIEKRAEKDFVSKLNLSLKTNKWSKGLIKDITGTNVEELWDDYQRDLHGADAATEAIFRN
jgi:hypothetical protein